MQPTLASGNTIGARLWTDGWMYAPMLPYRHRLVRCPHCEGLVWVNEQELVEVDDPYRVDHPRMQRPTVAQYLAFIDEPPELTPDELRYVRFHVWWFLNHDRRNQEEPAPLTPAEQANLRALAPLVSPDHDGDRLALAEIHRELGELEHARRLLEEPVEPDLEHVIRLLRTLVAAGDTALRLVPDPS